MSSMATASIDVRTAVLQALAAKEMRPVDLLLALGNTGYAESDVKQALSELLREGRVELTSHRMLRSAAKPDAA